MLFPESGGAPVLMPPDVFRGLIGGSLAFVSLAGVYKIWAGFAAHSARAST
jgi:hypothetical protein